MVATAHYSARASYPAQPELKRYARVIIIARNASKLGRAIEETGTRQAGFVFTVFTVSVVFLGCGFSLPERKRDSASFFCSVPCVCVKYTRASRAQRIYLQYSYCTVLYCTSVTASYLPNMHQDKAGLDWTGLVPVDVDEYCTEL